MDTSDFWGHSELNWKANIMLLLSDNVSPSSPPPPLLPSPLPLPPLTGRVFGRSQVHQVAEKRRKKIEEFCQVGLQLGGRRGEGWL